MSVFAFVLVGAIFNASPATVRPNPNTKRAGVLHDGALTVTLEAKRSLWRFSATRPPMTIEAFSDAGTPPLMPGPFIRVPAGTELRLTIRNSLAAPLTFVLPAAIHGGPDRIERDGLGRRRAGCRGHT